MTDYVMQPLTQNVGARSTRTRLTPTRGSITNFPSLITNFPFLRGNIANFPSLRGSIANFPFLEEGVDCDQREQDGVGERPTPRPAILSIHKIL